VSEPLDLEAACGGRSAKMQGLREAAIRVAPYPTSILLTGETGTGKGVIARAIHAASLRRSSPFVHVDCAGLAAPLLEAELYGVARGAYTGAHESRHGRFEAAGTGTLFLDEIAELPLTGQLKLLRVLEEGTFERVGETAPRRLQARVIAATHADLEAAVAERRFRADLYFRLRVAALRVPPLRERREDLGEWIESAAQRAALRLGVSPIRLDRAAWELLLQHEWPGNLRELFHLLEAATIWSEGGRVDAALVRRLLPELDLSIGASGEDSPHEGEPEGRRDSPLAQEIDRADGNLSRAARRLGIPRSTLRARAGLDDAAGRMRSLRRRRDRDRHEGEDSCERGESAPDQAQRDQAERQPVELREE
jgi:DNA-binding NtrC family response regulator